MAWTKRARRRPRNQMTWWSTMTWSSVPRGSVSRLCMCGTISSWTCSKAYPPSGGRSSNFLLNLERSTSLTRVWRLTRTTWSYLRASLSWFTRSYRRWTRTGLRLLSLSLRPKGMIIRPEVARSGQDQGQVMIRAPSREVKKTRYNNSKTHKMCLIILRQRRPSNTLKYIWTREQEDLEDFRRTSSSSSSRLTLPRNKSRTTQHKSSKSWTTTLSLKIMPEWGGRKKRNNTHCQLTLITESW